MGSLCDDTVFICHGEKQDDPSVISVSCLDKIGLGCDLSREILSFGLPIVQGDFVTDGEWCYLKFWVFGKKTTRWESLKKTLIKLCPARSTFSWIYHVNQDVQQLPKTPDVFLMKVRAFHRHSLELDVAEVISTLNLVIKGGKASTEPDGKVVNLYLTDTRELLHTEERQEEARDRLKDYLGDVMISCEIEPVSSEITSCSTGSSFLVPPSMSEDIFSLKHTFGLKLFSGLLGESSTIDVSSSPAACHYKQELQVPEIPEVFLMKLCALDRKGILHDILEVFHVLELVIRSTKVSTTPDGRVVDFFIIIDPRELLHTKERKEDTYDYLKVYLGDVMISCEIQSVGDISCYDWDHYGFGLDEELGVADWVGTCSYAPSIIQDMFSFELSNEHSSGPSPTDVNITTDNLSFPSHTLIHITCGNRKGLLYDITRTFKYLDIQICYARFSVKKRNTSEVVFHVKQKDGNKIVDPKKKKLIYHCLQMEILSPIRVAIVKQGIYTELQVANPVELSGIVRPLDVYDLSLALKMLDISVIMVVMMSHVIRSSVSEVYRVQAWEIYRICLSKGEDLYLPWSKIEGEVRKRLME
ncbi:hypothetical protein ACHQM5_016890 [Ranunculus cassubicifolius]